VDVLKLRQDTGLIEEYLKGNNLWSDVHRAPDTIYHPTMDMPRQGRVEELHAIWNNIFKELANSPARPAFMYFHSSPGVGKTFLLRELAMKSSVDIPENVREFAKNSLFISISFSGLMEISTDSNLYEHLIPGAKSNFVILWRILFSLFTSNCPWDKFINDIIKFYKGTYSDLKIWLKNLVTARYGNCRKILLVDEIIRLHALSEGWTDKCRQAIQTETKNPNRLFDLCITSTLSVELLKLTDVTSFTAASDTQLVPIIDLPLLTMEQSSNLILYFIDFYNLKIWDGNHQQMSDGRQLLARMFAELSGGHARSIEFLVQNFCTVGYEKTEVQYIINQAIRRAQMGNMAWIGTL